MRNIKRVNGKLTVEDADYCVDVAISESRLEGMSVTDEEVYMLRKYAYGEIIKDEYMAWVRGD